MAGAIQVWLATWIRSVQCQQVQRRGSVRIHRRSGGTPPEEDVSGRVFGISEEAWDRIQREIHLGVERRFFRPSGTNCIFAIPDPRLAPWATNLLPLRGSGKSEHSLQMYVAGMGNTSEQFKGVAKFASVWGKRRRAPARGDRSLAHGVSRGSSVATNTSPGRGGRERSPRRHGGGNTPSAFSCVSLESQICWRKPRQI